MLRLSHIARRWTILSRHLLYERGRRRRTIFGLLLLHPLTRSLSAEAAAAAAAAAAETTIPTLLNPESGRVLSLPGRRRRRRRRRRQRNQEKEG